ncbi:DNA polymerase [Mycobacteroides abscessus subsp. bolletii]|uniref:exonuclease domain-containing protein n=1 Tax=Mycobacteroides abscessus TaxID=36809 RepID=UPI0009CEE9A9|nr:exonuclease domain-containing protein [Mycobacteroides abscessus]SKG74758.1 DNA polymerase [Mycobacteroides abscessus subsp. bolletii]SKH26311.1 DNA polymerase [Mycobacteroides abscessus subsp. bolletii]
MTIAEGWYADPWAEAPLRWWDGAQWTAWIHSPETRPTGGPPPKPQAVDQPARLDESQLSSLLGGADRIAVVDVETTGLFSADRVVEVAVVTIDRNGTIVDEFESLTNPLRDPGPTWLHGLTPSVLRDAPLFEDIALHLAALLDGAVVAAHNLRFDRRLLGYEFDRAGIHVDWGDGLDTLPAVGGCKLGAACADYEIQLHDAHCALNDARATAHLLLKVAGAFRSCRPAAATPLSADVPRVLTRDGFTAVDIRRPYILQLARGLHSPVDVAPYVTLLDYAVADLKVDADESRELALLAEDLGLTEHRRARAHTEFLLGLIDAALDDGVVTDEEFEQLCRTAALLDLDDSVVCARTNPYRVRTETVELQAGMRVCFTGAAQPPSGEQVEREDLEASARRHNLEPVTSVTKANCQLLVAADPASMSGKAKNAQKFGIPVASVADFLAALESRSPLTVNLLPVKGVGLVCTTCGYSWIAARRRTDPVCDDCRERVKPPRGPNDGRNVANSSVRTERLERCRQAVEYQRSGATRKQIGESLGVSEEAVKALLRDGKFYADPTADPQRLELAQRAAAARANGITRTVFGDQTGLSKGKADESWKDADVLFGESRTVLVANEESQP